MENNFRGLAAFVVAPLVTPLVFTVYFAAQNGWKWDGGLFALIAVVSYLFVGTVGVPVLLIYHRRGIKSLGEFAGGGAMIGLLAAVILLILFKQASSEGVVLFGALSMVSGFL